MIQQTELNHALITSEKVTGCILAAMQMQSIGQEIEYLHQMNLARVNVRRLEKELQDSEKAAMQKAVDVELHVMD